MQNKFEICAEKPYPLGCYIDYDKSLVVRAVFGKSEKRGITLYPCADDTDTQPISISFHKNLKRGAIYSARIRNIKDIDKYESYNYFEDDSYFCDPYAKHVIGLEHFGAGVPDSEIRAKLDNKANRISSSTCFDWGDDKAPSIPYEDSFIYLLHVRGFTKSPSSGIASSKRGTFSGIIEKLPYLKDLHVTTLELMPVVEMNEVETPIKRPAPSENGAVVYSKNGSFVSEEEVTKRLNFWGYKKGYYFAPRTSYCENPSDAENEFKTFVKTMHENGIEVVLQFFFEEKENESLIVDVLRFWRCTYHVDGFHLKGARLPIRQIVRDPLFMDVKIWYDWFDAGDIYGGEVPDKKYLAIYNNSFMYAARRFLKSDDNTVSDFFKAMISNSTDLGIINYVCDYEGFRLADLVSYEHKHNEENCENNKDGTDNNLSWNCGIEGRTRRHNILELRKKQMKNILSMLLLGQGTPMIFSGDEFGNSQGGNNNPYCQDNEISWVDWKALDKNRDLFDFVKLLTEIRFSNKAFHSDKPFKLMDYISCGYPDLSCHGKDAWRPDLSGYSHVLGMLYCGLYDKASEDKPFFYVCYNMHWQNMEFALPTLPEGYKWELVVDTALEAIQKPEEIKVPAVEVIDSKDKVASKEVLQLQSERSVRIYKSIVDVNYKKKKDTKKKNGKK